MAVTTASDNVSSKNEHQNQTNGSNFGISTVSNSNDYTNIVATEEEDQWSSIKTIMEDNLQWPIIS